MNIDPSDSLLRYELPQLIAQAQNKRGAKPATKQLAQMQMPGQQSKSEDYLNSILPPCEYNDNGQMFVKYVSA